MSVKDVLLQRLVNRRAFGPVTGLINHYIDEKIRSLPNLVPNTNISEEDVFITGYPKSGHTWFQTLVAGVIYGIDFDYMPYSVVWDLVPDHAWPYYRRYSTPTFFKSYDFPQPQYRRVVYLLRDGRDVMVSCYHQMVAVRNQRGQKRDFLQVVQGCHGDYPEPTKWHEHVQAWLSNPYGAHMLIIRYEELKRDAVKEVQRFCQFVGVERDHALVEQAAQQGSFQQMRDKERREGLGNPMGGRRLPLRLKNQPVVRRGEVGSYKDEMPAEILDVFLQDAGDTLRKLGYL